MYTWMTGSSFDLHFVCTILSLIPVDYVVNITYNKINKKPNNCPKNNNLLHAWLIALRNPLDEIDASNYGQGMCGA